MTLLFQMGLLLVLAWALGTLAQHIKLPAILGMIAGGLIVGAISLPDFAPGPVLDDVSSLLRLVILTVVLLRAGLGISATDLKSAGALGIRLGAIPMLADAALVTAGGVWLLGLSFASALVLGFLVAAISPAIVIPGLLDLLDRHSGRPRRILTALLVSSPLDNILALVGLGIALDIALAGAVSWQDLALVLPQKIGLGLLIGAVVGGVLGGILRKIPSASAGLQGAGAIWIIGGGLIAVGRLLDFSFVLAIITAGCMVRAVSSAAALELAGGLKRIWSRAQYVLFGLIGAAVDIHALAAVGALVCAVIVLGQLGRAGGSLLATCQSALPFRHRLAAICCTIPKATIQAAFAALPLDRGLADGDLILSAAVLAIVITAPIGVITLHQSSKLLGGLATEQDAPPHR